jgi:hypothetical protein
MALNLKGEENKEWLHKKSVTTSFFIPIGMNRVILDLIITEVKTRFPKCTESIDTYQ